MILSEFLVRILLTGATGYVGGRLLAALEANGHRVRCLARRPEFLEGRVGRATEIVAGDCLQPETLGAGLADVDTAFYMVHSMGSTGDFEEQDRAAATNFGRAAKAAGVRKIVYLGGLGDQSARSPAICRAGKRPANACWNRASR